jgi:hypothetical protein
MGWAIMFLGEIMKYNNKEFKRIKAQIEQNE